MRDTWLDRFFRDKNGNIVIIQPPNLPIMVWAISSFLQVIFKTGIIHTGLETISLIAIFIWSLAEIFQGVNYFRRSLGVFVLIVTIVSKLS
ncbi:hypothetical protein [Chamaesiphon minutus]|uniref:Uncharacterized protein n=1 Tax=Chamaesiphon minutus (strain ATCC 27169 / PCC 6605) TaxID=1173020 RepID=K9UGI3_CHAP6|nr:hypothetical protein [Chamaesiphon minutus]AFY93546.1 hypothetical protein Cha6605_2492 [Chamaesiphon minutus PCC 6605]